MARDQQRTPQWQAALSGQRPKVERKISHLMHRAWGGRHAHVRGHHHVATDVDTHAGAINFARLAVLGLAHDGASWSVGGA